MPGLAGFIQNGGDNKNVLKEVLSLLTYTDQFYANPIFEDGLVTGAGIWPHAFQAENSMLENDEFVIWRDGNWFNESEVQKYFQFQNQGLALIEEASIAGKLKSTLNKLDGLFSLVIYNKKEKTIQLISDRLGFKPLYYYLSGQAFGWSSEVKGFFKMPFFKKKIRNTSFQTFLKIGHLVGNQTWFENTFLTAPASVHTFHVDSLSFSVERYWNWSEIKSRRIKIDEAAEQLAFLIKSAVKKRVSPDKKYGLMLSGGLDSRTILAALPKGTLTELLNFGYPNTWDVNLGHKVAAEVDFPLNYQKIQPENWLNGKKEAIWRTDGMKDLQHLHLSPFLKEFKKYQASFDGILGGVLLGGIYAGKTVKTVSRPFLNKISEPSELNFESFPESIPESFIIENRIRRFSIHGAGSIAAESEVVYPFYANDILDFTLSILKEYRMESKVFLKSLSYFKKPYLLNIPWQRTGLLPKFIFLNQLVQEFKIIQVLRKFGLLSNYGFASYENWTSNSEFFKKEFERCKLILKNYDWFGFSSKQVNNDFDFQTRVITIAYWIESSENNF